MKPKDELLLKKAVSEIKKIPRVVGIVQTGSSVYSEKYNDVDVLVFFDCILPPPELKKIKEKYKKHKFWIEGIINYVNPVRRVFIKVFNNSRAKKVLFGKNPYENLNFELSKSDVLAYILNQYWVRDIYGVDYGNVLAQSLNALLAYKNKFPKSKYETLLLFKTEYPELIKYLPKNAEGIIKNTTKTDFAKLYLFFEKTVEWLAK